MDEGTTTNEIETTETTEAIDTTAKGEESTADETPATEPAE